MDENEDEEDFGLPWYVLLVLCLSAVAENQPANKNRMTTELSNFAARLCERMPSFRM